MSERNIHNAICQYLRLQYPAVHFKTDLSGAYLGHGNYKTKGDKASTTSHPGFPDIIIYELSTIGNESYCGLALELKATSPYTKNNILKSNQHLIEQNQWLTHLSSIGFKAHFSTGIDETMQLIDEYLNQSTNT